MGRCRGTGPEPRPECPSRVEPAAPLSTDIVAGTLWPWGQQGQTLAVGSRRSAGLRLPRESTPETPGEEGDGPRRPGSWGPRWLISDPVAPGANLQPFVWSLARLLLTLGSYHRNRHGGWDRSRVFREPQGGRCTRQYFQPVSRLHPSSFSKVYGRWGCPGGWERSPQLLPALGPRPAALWGCSTLRRPVKWGAPQLHTLPCFVGAAAHGRGSSRVPGDVDLLDPARGPRVPPELCAVLPGLEGQSWPQPGTCPAPVGSWLVGAGVCGGSCVAAWDL